MSTIITAAILIAGTMAIFYFLISINKKNTARRNSALVNTFNQVGADYGLVFSNKEILKNKILGLDDTNRKLLVFDLTETTETIKIDLHEVKDCTFEKEYEQVDFGNAKRSDIELQLQAIVIKFRFKKRSDIFSLAFYDCKIHSIYEMRELESRAKNWEILLTEAILKDKEAARA